MIPCGLWIGYQGSGGVCQKLIQATDATVNYTEEDANPPDANAVSKATEASSCTKEAVEPIFNQMCKPYSNLVLSRLGDCGIQSWKSRLPTTLERLVWSRAHGKNATGHGLHSWTASPFTCLQHSRVMQPRCSNSTSVMIIKAQQGSDPAVLCRGSCNFMAI